MTNLDFFLNHKLSKGIYLKKSDIKPDFENSLFKVPSEKSRNMFYSVDTKASSCTCSSGLFGGFCKHQAAVFLHLEECSAAFHTSPAASLYVDYVEPSLYPICEQLCLEYY